jgi:hypothetical protein
MKPTNYKLQVGSFEDSDFMDWFTKRGFRIKDNVVSRRTCMRCSKPFGYFLKRGVVDRRTCRKCITLRSYRTLSEGRH